MADGPSRQKRGASGAARRAPPGPLRAFPDQRRELDDAPDGPAPGPGAGADARPPDSDGRPAGQGAASRRAELRIRVQVGRHPGSGLQPGRDHQDPEPEPGGCDAALPGGAAALRGAGLARGRAGRRAGGAGRQGAPQLRAASAADGPELGDGDPAQGARGARLLHDLRPPLPERAVAAERAVPRAAGAAGGSQAGGTGLANAGLRARPGQGDAGGQRARRPGRGDGQAIGQRI